MRPAGNAYRTDRVEVPLRQRAYEFIRFHVATPFLGHVRASAIQRNLEQHRIRQDLRDAHIVAVMTVKNEGVRLRHHLDYYRQLGAQHFVIIDNESTDDTKEFCLEQQDVSYIVAHGSYAQAHYGTDWINYVLRRYCIGKWVLWIDVDELLLFTSGRNDLATLTEHLENRGRRSLQTLLLDMYSERTAPENLLATGQDPREICQYYDRTGYSTQADTMTGTTWIKGGVRGRIFFEHNIWDGPALNKSPLIRWRRHQLFVRSSHILWPRQLNGAGPVNGILLHFKFTSTATQKIAEESDQKQHTEEYLAYRDIDDRRLVGPDTKRFVGFPDLVSDGLVTPILHLDQ